MRRVSWICLLALLLAACSSTPQPNGTPSVPAGIATPLATPATTVGPEQATITFAAWDYERPLYEALAKKFHQDNPTITVVVIPLDDLVGAPDPNKPDTGPSDILRRVVAGADTAPASILAPELNASPLLLDLAPLMDADATFQRDDFYPGMLNRYTTKGAMWALPRSLNTQILRYNKALFRAAGLPDPKPGWTWSDLLAAAEQAQQSSGAGTIGLLDNGSGMLTLAALLKQRGIDLATLTLATADLTNPAYLEAIDQLRGLIRKGVVAPTYGVNGERDPQQMVRDGQVVLWGGVDLFNSDGKLEPIPYPAGQVPYPGDSPIDLIIGSGVEGYMASAGTAYPEASWKWIEFLTRQVVEPATDTGWQTGRLPARKALADLIKFWDGQDAQSTAALRWALENVRTASGVTDYSVFGSVNGVLSQVLSDPKTNVKEALLSAQRDLERMRADLASATPTPQPDTSPVIVATPEPVGIPDGATVVNFASWNYNGTDLRRLIRSFRQEHPEIYVQIKNTDTFTNIVGIGDLAKISDCFAWNGPVTTAKDRATLLDLQPLLDADATFPRDDIPAAFLSVYQQDGALYGLPYAASIRTLNYNRALFDKAGVTPPTGSTPWTPEQFLQAAQALSNGEGKARVYGYVPLGGPQQNDLQFFVSTLGGRFFTNNGTTSVPNYAAPETTKAIRWYLDLASVQKVAPAYFWNYRRDDSRTDDTYDLVQNNRGAMWIDFGRSSFGQPVPPPNGPAIDVGAPVAPGTIDVGIAPLPVGTTGLASSDLTVRGFHISKQAKNPQACWEFIKFMGSDLNQIYGDLPARTSIANSAAYKAIAAPDRLEMLQIYSEILKKPLRAGDDANSIYNSDPYWLLQALSAASSGKADLAKALAAAQKTTTAYNDCVASGTKSATCALKTDPEYQGYNTDEPSPIDKPAGMAP